MASENGWTRREFHAAGLALGAAALFGGEGLVGSARAAHRRPDTGILRVGVIGCGGRGTGAVIQALAADPDSVLWAVGDLYPERLEPCIKEARGFVAEEAEDPDAMVRHKVRIEPGRMFSGFDCYQKVIDSGVDVVILTTPPGFRPQHLRAAVEAGKHVFCEKPVAVDAPGVRSVLESARIAKEKNLSLMSGFCWRYQDQVRETFTKLHEGGIGQIRAIQTTYNTTGWIQPKSRKPEWTDAEFMTRNWHYFHPISGDHIVEQAVHAIDWQAWAMRDAPPERCWAVGGRQTRADLPETGNVFDHFSVTYEYAGGVRAYHMCRHWENTPSDNSALFMGTEGVCTMQPWQQTHVIDGVKPWRGAAKSNDMYQREHDLLFKAIRAGSPVNDGVFMSHSTLLGIMGRMAAYTGQVITWEQALNSSEDLNQQPWAFGERNRPALAKPGSTVFS
jgi:myo-inositol 2-dehydrogenase/D-chiro-inositol 1-dehydrogenase